MQRDFTAEADGPEFSQIMEAVGEICRVMDIPRPIWLDKHENQMDRFGRTTFFADDFMEAVSFDRFELEILREKGKSKDPRNDFSL